MSEPNDTTKDGPKPSSTATAAAPASDPASTDGAPEQTVVQSGGFYSTPADTLPGEQTPIVYAPEEGDPAPVVLRVVCGGIPQSLRVPTADGENYLVVTPEGTPIDPAAVESVKEAAAASGVTLEEVK